MGVAYEHASVMSWEECSPPKLSLLRVRAEVKCHLHDERHRPFPLAGFTPPAYYLQSETQEGAEIVDAGGQYKKK